MTLPRGWAEATLGDVGDLYSGQSVSASEVNSAGLGPAYVTGPDQWDGREVRRDKWTEHPKKLVPAGCIFVTVKGAGVGKLFPGIECAIGRDIYAYKGDGGLDPSFIYRALQHRIAIIIREARGDIPGLSREHLTGHSMTFPPLAEQRRIVAKLDALTARIARARAELDRVPVLARNFRRRALLNCFDRADVPSTTVGRILTGIEAGKNLRCDERPPREDEKGVVKVSAVTWGRFDPTQAKTFPSGYQPPEKARIRNGDLLFSRANTIELVGAIALVEHAPENLFLSDKVLRLHVDDDDKRWLMWFLRSPEGRKQIEQLATGNQLSMRNLSQSALRSIRLPYPNSETRASQIAQLESAFARADRMEAEAARARKLLDRLESAILARAFRGELVPQDPDDEPASVLLERIRAERANAPKQKRGRRRAGEASGAAS
ncbi:restriction endonuclease subunit S [Consotaella salsifontis]|uniref:Type I restriction enzyme, S subunit n=1 Tax=Consotaella salsifontis TaxID=1365950 RepID=A0A1T4S2D8_9HYPH|nr:restriction endonuclease subunit S [Consotaella salsifontis]SKA22395.1 type I restriction enzyme, S subunit [Consotaella salsifontis]